MKVVHPDLVKVTVHASGRAGVEQDGRRCLLKPGDLVNYATDHPCQLTFFSGDAARHLTDALVSLVISELLDVPVERAESELADRILAYCATRLADPTLTVESVARAHRISVRYLHKTLESRDLKLSAWIRRRRLEGIRRDLADPALVDRTAAVIAARWGMLDPTHLSRALKAEFGRTAAEIRRSASRS